jgi:plasmid stabilization system protein ParE
VKLILSAKAAADMARLHRFLAEADSQAARRAIAVLGEAIQSLEGLPSRGRPSGIPGVRELIVPFGTSAYVLRYAFRARREEIVILRIWHGRESR